MKKEYQGEANKIHPIELPSSIEQVSWGQPFGICGAKAMLEIFTQFVGIGSELKVMIKDEDGKQHGEVTTKIFGNHHSLEFKIPAEARLKLYADVALPELGLKASALPMWLLPKVEISNLRWSQRELKRQNIIKMSASIQGPPDGAPVAFKVFEQDALYAHDHLTTLHTRVTGGRAEVEWLFDYHGSTAQIPTKDESPKGYQQPSLFFRVSVADVFADSPPLKFLDEVYLTVKDVYGHVLKNMKCIFHFADGSQKQTQTNTEGLAHLQNVPPGKIRITFQPTNKAMVIEEVSLIVA
ncbi:MAG: hypothetical protein JNN12_01935 [Bacteroidetes Order II. Incertae sedis bacterium]|nr:hypothetical protein [Bacteroidetes Order II. bacterium]